MEVAHFAMTYSQLLELDNFLDHNIENLVYGVPLWLIDWEEDYDDRMTIT